MKAKRFKSELTNKQWARIAPFLDKPDSLLQKGLRRISNRRCFEGILWVLRSGARWSDLPPWYPSPSTCWRRLQEWEDRDVWLDAWRAFLAELDKRGQLKWAETFADGNFAPAQKGGSASEKPNAERVRSGWWWQTAKEFLWGTTWTLGPLRKSH